MAFQADLEFWGIDDSILESCCREKYERKLATVNQEMERECFEMQEDAPEIFPNNCMGRFQKLIWDLMEHPESSCTANMVSYISMMFVIVSTIGMSLNTMPGLKVVDQNSELQNNPMLERIEAVCIAWFTMEFVIRSDSRLSPAITIIIMILVGRLVGSPSKKEFLQSGMNLIDVLAILPYVNIAWLAG